MSLRNPELLSLERRESADLILKAPPVETLLQPKFAGSSWPSQVTENPTLRAEASQRRALIEGTDALFGSVTNIEMDVAEAVEGGLVSEEELTSFYDSWSDTLDANSDVVRVVLYFPFEFIPNTTWSPKSELLARSAMRFRESFLRSWRSLLGTYDVRANFVDGDIPEPELRDGPLPRVSKAAHLLPKLIEKGLVTFGDARALADEYPDEIFQQSLAEALAVAENSSNETMPRSDTDSLSIDAFEDLPEIIETALQGALKEFSQGTTKISASRLVWEHERVTERIVARCASVVADRLANTPEEVDVFVTYLTQHEVDEHTREVAIYAVREAVEMSARTDIEQARILYEKFAEVFGRWWSNPSLRATRALSGLWSYLAHRRVISEGAVPSDAALPPLDASFFGNEKQIQGEIPELASYLRAFESDPLLKDAVYPVTVVFGSRIKGYGTKDADLDSAVFIKPDVSETDRKEVREAITRTLSENRFGGKPVEFWLQEEKDTLSVRNFPDADARTADGTWTHILFGGAWYGKRETISLLHERLLAHYLRSGNEKESGVPSMRSVWLEEMEREALQYRLMHKGYVRRHPVLSSQWSKCAAPVDGESVFWDPGYRRLATKLYLQKVFLPHLGPT